MTGFRFVALGDSVTVGLGDPMPEQTWRGWAGLLAESLGAPGQVSFHNLAELGAVSYRLVDRQLPAALRIRPTIAAVIVGTNDTLRGSFDIARTGTALNYTVGRLRAAGATVLTCRLPDPGLMFGLPAPLARQLSRRIAAINTITDSIAARYGAIHFDAATHPGIYERRMWSVDRLHPSEQGHRLLARGFAELLADRGFPIYRLPALEPTNPAPTRAASAWWLATKGSKWVFHRSMDLIPNLVAMSAVEWWTSRLGPRSGIDQRLNIDIARTLGILSGDPVR